MNGWDFDSIESVDQLYNGNDLFLLEMDNFIDKRKCVFSITLSDNSTNELYCIWNYYNNTECWEFGNNWVLINIKEQIKMKHLVKVQAVVESESSDLREIAVEGLKKILQQVHDEFVVVDVYKNCLGVELICIQNKELNQVEQGGKNVNKKGKN